MLGRYGDIALLMDWRAIAADLVIFNGDVKNPGPSSLETRGAKIPDPEAIG